MRLPPRRRYLLTADVQRVDRGAVDSAVRAWVREIAERSEAVRVTSYGSVLTGVATPRSDVDDCVVVRGDTTTPPHMRGMDHALTVPTPTAFVIAVWTETEAARLADCTPTWSRAIATERCASSATREQSRPDATSGATFKMRTNSATGRRGDRTAHGTACRNREALERRRQRISSTRAAWCGAT